MTEVSALHYQWKTCDPEEACRPLGYRAPTFRHRVDPACHLHENLTFLVVAAFETLPVVAAAMQVQMKMIIASDGLQAPYPRFRRLVGSEAGA